MKRVNQLTYTNFEIKKTLITKIKLFMYHTLGDGKNTGCVTLVVGIRPIN